MKNKKFLLQVKGDQYVLNWVRIVGTIKNK